jgi:hypothetical protein
VFHEWYNSEISFTEGFQVNSSIRRRLAVGKRRIEQRLSKFNSEGCEQPMLRSANIQYELAERMQGLTFCLVIMPLLADHQAQEFQTCGDANIATPLGSQLVLQISAPTRRLKCVIQSPLCCIFSASSKVIRLVESRRRKALSFPVQFHIEPPNLRDAVCWAAATNSGGSG